MSGEKKQVALAVNKETMKVMEDFAASQGLDARAYINSILESYVEWYILAHAISMVVVRHDGGEHFSFFCAKCYEHFFNLLTIKRVAVANDPSTIFIRLVVATGEVDGMKHYLEEVLKEVKGKPGAEQGEA